MWSRRGDDKRQARTANRGVNSRQVLRDRPTTMRDDAVDGASTYILPRPALHTRGQDVPSTRTRPLRKQTNETNRKHTNLTAIVPASQRARPQTYTWSNMEANAPPQPQSCVTFGFCEECVTVLCFNNRGSSSASASAAPQGKLEVVVCASHARLSCWCVSRL